MCVLDICSDWGSSAVCLSGEVFVHHGRSRPDGSVKGSRGNKRSGGAAGVGYYLPVSVGHRVAHHAFVAGYLDEHSGRL